MATIEEEAESPNDSEQVNKAIAAHQNALDDLVKVNSIFTSAVFLGLSYSGQDQVLQQNPTCKPPDIKYYTRRLILYEVISFACFLMSSLVAKALKVHLGTHRLHEKAPSKDKVLLNKSFRGFILFLIMWGSILGCLFLLLSMNNIVIIRLGKLSCNDANTLQSTLVLLTVNSFALVIYVPFMCQAIWVSMTKIDQKI